MVHELYVGNLDFSVTASELSGLFEAFGPVRAARLGHVRGTDRPAGFGFIEMGAAAADAAVLRLGGAVYRGRPLTVLRITPRPRRPAPPTAGPAVVKPAPAPAAMGAALERALRRAHRRGRQWARPARALLAPLWIPAADLGGPR